jgi:hypothetical protein
MTDCTDHFISLTKIVYKATNEETKDTIQRSQEHIKSLTDTICSCPNCLKRLRKQGV